MTTRSFSFRLRQNVSIWLSLAWFYLRTGKYLSKTFLVISIVAGGLILYQVGYFTADNKHRNFEEGLNKIMRDLSLWETGTLDEYLAILKREIEISRSTVKELNALIYENTIRVNDLKEKIYFYQSVIAPEELNKSLSIFDVTISQPFEKNNYFIEVVLRKSQKKDTLIKGHIKISIYGKHSRDEDANLGNEPLEFSFRYFQRVRGILDIPPEFQPEQVKISVSADHGQPFEQIYAWQDIIDPDIVLLDG